MKSCFSEVSKHRKREMDPTQSSENIKYVNLSGSRPKRVCWVFFLSVGAICSNSAVFHQARSVLLELHFCTSFFFFLSTKYTRRRTLLYLFTCARHCLFAAEWQWTWPKASSAGGSERMQIYLGAAADLPMNLRSLPSLSAGNAPHMGPCRNVSLWNIGKRVPVPTICTHGTSCFTWVRAPSERVEFSFFRIEKQRCSTLKPGLVFGETLIFMGIIPTSFQDKRKTQIPPELKNNLEVWYFFFFFFVRFHYENVFQTGEKP